jgi:hypothetical protein
MEWIHMLPVSRRAQAQREPKPGSLLGSRCQSLTQPLGPYASLPGIFVLYTLISEWESLYVLQMFYDI